MPSMPIIPSHSIDMLRDSMLQMPDSFILGNPSAINMTNDQEYAMQNIIGEFPIQSELAKNTLLSFTN